MLRSSGSASEWVADQWWGRPAIGRPVLLIAAHQQYASPRIPIFEITKLKTFDSNHCLQKSKHENPCLARTAGHYSGASFNWRKESRLKRELNRSSSASFVSNFSIHSSEWWHPHSVSLVHTHTDARLIETFCPILCLFVALALVVSLTFSLLAFVLHVVFLFIRRCLFSLGFFLSVGQFLFASCTLQKRYFFAC